MPDNLTRRAFLGNTAAAATLAAAPLASAPLADFASTTLDDAPPVADDPNRPLVLLARGLPDATIRKIGVLASNVKIVIAGSDNALWQKTLPDADIFYGGFTGDDLKAAVRLKWIQWGAAGVETILSPELVGRPILLTNAKGSFAPAIAEHVFGLLFALTRRIGISTRHMAENRWESPGALTELRGRTMGVVGLGGIGRETARRAKAMDMKVIAVDIAPLYREMFHFVDGIRPVDDGFFDLLSVSDVVVSAIPHTRKTQGIFDENAFAQIKSGAYFINVSRGKVVKTNALVDALKSGRVAGAGLDVTDPEPLTKGHPLWAMENVIITPHVAGQSQFSGQRVQDVFVENVHRFVNGQPLLNLVDKKAGF